jgi:hypothetical protein
MNELAITPVAMPDLWARAEFVPPAIVLSLNGNADLRAADEIARIVSEVHAEALRLAVSEVVVDFRNLEFMNSSCFKSFVKWLSLLQALGPKRDYQLRVRSDAAKHWQKRSLRALSCFAVGLVRVET